MSDDPRQPDRPLSRRERRERAQAEPADGAASPTPDDRGATPAPDGRGAAAAHDGQDPRGEASVVETGGAPRATGGAEPLGAERVDPAPGETDPSAPAAAESAVPQAAEPGDPDAAEPDDRGEAGTDGDTGPTRRGRSEQAPAAPAIPAGGSIEALLHRDPEPPKPKRGKGCLIAIIIVLVLIGGAAAGGLWAWNTYGERVQDALGLGGPHDYEDGEATGEALIRVEEGDTGEALSPRLHEAGVTLEEDSFTRYLRENGLNPTLYAGVYKLQQRMTSEAVVVALEDPANRQENAVQLPEGLTVDASIERISEAVDVPLADLEKAVKTPSDYGVEAESLEGWLFPATYTFETDTTAAQIVQTMVDRTRQSLASAGVPDAEAHEVLTIASIIQREARFEDDFYKVSRVIHNRLDPKTWGDTNGLLQMDSTAQYGYGEHHSGKASSSKGALSDENGWNTYKVVGLPKGPIANPGDLAIDAAMHPVDGPWLYFVTVDLNSGETKFTDSYAQQQKNVKQWRSWCAENPDAGC